ncbi:MAG: radical SAM protein [Firmicutes bacterium]|nr:radical SAM protein [Bacillota bacterium]
MKKHAIIPIFIPHIGCGHACVFCDQRQITARSGMPTIAEARETIETWLTTLRDVPEVEISFFGGSFTGIPVELQREYLSLAKEYKDAGRITGIHMSTRPDYIDDEILDLLCEMTVDAVEFGVQSFDDDVLRLSKRGHNAETARRAARMIKAIGITLGIQLMIGLPGDSLEACVYSARETVKLGPELARLYPTLILPGTELHDMYLAGRYTPLTRGEAVLRTKEMYEILMDAGINIMRVGLKSTEIISSERLGDLNKGTYHPAFRQLVESEIAKERVSALLDEYIAGMPASGTAADGTAATGTAGASRPRVTVLTSPEWFSNLIGQHGEARDALRKKYGALDPEFSYDPALTGCEFRIEPAR